MVAFAKGVEIENIVICWPQRTLEILKTFKTAQYVRFIDNFSSLEVFFVYVDYRGGTQLLQGSLWLVDIVLGWKNNQQEVD